MDRTTIFSDSKNRISLKSNSQPKPETGILEEGYLFFEDLVPAFVDSELEELYGNLYSSLGKLRAYGFPNAVSTYIARKNGKTSALFLFRIRGNRVYVLNEAIKIDNEEINKFSAAVFQRFGFISAISFNAVHTSGESLTYPYQRVNCLENFIVSLPKSVEEYSASLGKSTKRDITYKLNKLKREFPSFSYHFYEKEDLTELHVREIIRLHFLRMKEKNKNTSSEDLEVDRILKLVKECNGFVGVATIDNEICGGLINFRIRNNYFMKIIAHDPRYNKFSLGRTCCFLTICECIRRGGEEFNLLWGQLDYKRRLLGMKLDLDEISVFRSPYHKAMNADMVLTGLWRDLIRKTKLWLLNPENYERRLSKVAWRLIYFSRRHRASDSP